MSDLDYILAAIDERRIAHYNVAALMLSGEAVTGDDVQTVWREFNNAGLGESWARVLRSMGESRTVALPKTDPRVQVAWAAFNADAGGDAELLTEDELRERMDFGRIFRDEAEARKSELMDLLGKVPTWVWWAGGIFLGLSIVGSIGRMAMPWRGRE